MSDGGFDRLGPRQSGSESTPSGKRGVAPGKATRTSKLPPRASRSIASRERAEAPAVHVKSPSG